MSPAKTAELMKMPFGLWTQVGARNHVLDGEGPDPHVTGSFEPIEMPFEMWTRVGPRKHY